MEIVRSGRKTLGIQVRADGTVVVRAPLRMPEAEILQAVERHRSWIEKTAASVKSAAPEPEDRLTETEIRALADRAMAVLPPLARAWAQRLGVRFGRITIRNQRSKWGSCSAQGNLNFNCLLMLCPEAVVEYVVVHELCHRKHMNHSPAFWAEVEKALPDYRTQEAWLKAHGTQILRRMTG